MFKLDVTGNGNVPKYDFQLVSNDTVYSVQFMQFYEAIPQPDGSLKKNGNSNIALASLTWEWTDIIDDGNGDLHFVITAYDGGHGNNKQFSSLVLTNHIKANVTMNSDNTTLSAPLLKFDVEINDYAWVSTEENAKVVLIFSFSSPGLHPEKKDGKVMLGDAFFKAADSADSFDSPDSVTSVPVTTDYENGAGIWVVYDHWTGKHLLHDPELGFGDEPSSDNALMIALIVVGVVVLAGLVIAFVVYRQRLRYQSI